ncbi:MAG: hypothetical protein ACLQOO_12890 [Terriglobia bacterium]
MLTVLRKLFGLVALIWLAWVALTLVMFCLTAAGERDAAAAAGGGFLVSAITGVYIGVPSCLAWFGLKLVQVLGQRKNPTQDLRGAYYAGPWPAAPLASAPPQPRRDYRMLVPSDTAKPTDRGLGQQASAPHASSSDYTYGAPGQLLCPKCGLRPALFYCRVHHAPVCLTCIGSHDVPAECSYVPGWRLEAAFAGEAHDPDALYHYQAPGLPLCPTCARLPALVHCSVHHLSLCLTCIGTHDQAAECSYVPGWRTPKASGPSSQTGSLQRAASKPKKGDIFGIS